MSQRCTAATGGETGSRRSPRSLLCIPATRPISGATVREQIAVCRPPIKSFALTLEKPEASGS